MYFTQIAHIRKRAYGGAYEGALHSCMRAQPALAINEEIKWDVLQCTIIPSRKAAIMTNPQKRPLRSILIVCRRETREMQ